MRGDDSTTPSALRRRIATVVALIGLAVVAGHLARAWPRETEVMYEVDADVVQMDVDYLKEGEAVASTRFKRPSDGTPVFRHTVRLQPGQYHAEITAYGVDGRGVEHRRVLIVPARGTTRFDLRE